MSALLLRGEMGLETDRGAYKFVPCFSNISKIGEPKGIVSDFCRLQSGSPHSLMIAHNVLSACCTESPDDSDLDELLGMWIGDDSSQIDYIEGDLPASSAIILALSLMKNGIIGDTSKAKKSGNPLKEFDASEFVGAAMAHLGASSADAWAMTMIEFQKAIKSKFPDADSSNTDDYPDKDEYERIMAMAEEVNQKNG